MGAPAVPPAEPFLAELIKNQRRAVRFYLLSAAFIILLGISCIVAAVHYQEAFRLEGFKGLIELAGLFVSAVSTWPLREMLNRQEKVGIFCAIQTRMQVLESSHNSMDQTEHQRYDALLWQAIEKTALS